MNRQLDYDVQQCKIEVNTCKLVQDSFTNKFTIVRGKITGAHSWRRRTARTAHSMPELLLRNTRLDSCSCLKACKRVQLYFTRLVVNFEQPVRTGRPPKKFPLAFCRKFMEIIAGGPRCCCTCRADESAQLSSAAAFPRRSLGNKERNAH